MYRTRFAITFEKLPKSTDGATRAKYPVDTPVLTHLRLYPGTKVAMSILKLLNTKTIVNHIEQTRTYTLIKITLIAMVMGIICFFLQGET